MHGCSDDERSVQIQSTFSVIFFLFFSLLTVNISHTSQVTDVVWGFRITDGSVYSGWVFVVVLFCLFFDMEVETTVHPLMTSMPQEKMLFKRHLCPECEKVYVKKKILLRHRKQHHLVYLIHNVTWNLLSGDIHSHMNSVHLKIKTL